MEKFLRGLGIDQGKRFELLFLAVLSLVFLVLPFTTYAFNRTTYTLSGIESLVGKTVLSGKVVLEPSWLMGFVVASTLLVALIALLAAKFSLKQTGTALIVLGLVQLAANVLAAKKINALLEAAKTVKTGIGSTLLIVVSLVMILLGMLILKEAKVLSALDFMVLPGVAYFLINNYIPMAGILIAFKKIDYSLGIFKSSWIGFENFKYLFTTNDAFIITRNTLLYNIVFILIGNAMGIMAAIALSEVMSKRLQKFFQTSLLLPFMISMVIVSYIVFGFLGNQSGWINHTFFTEDTAINFYQSKFYWPFILTIVNTWKILGYSTIIYLTSVIGIDGSLYEAAYVDGCGKFKQITRITLPLLKPTIITMILIQVGRIFYSDFGLFYQVPMSSGTLFSVTQTIDTYVYRSLLQSNNIAMASAAGAYQSIVGFALVMFVNYIVRKMDQENALF